MADKNVVFIRSKGRVIPIPKRDYKKFRAKGGAKLGASKTVSRKEAVSELSIKQKREKRMAKMGKKASKFTLGAGLLSGAVGLLTKGKLSRALKIGAGVGLGLSFLQHGAAGGSEEADKQLKKDIGRIKEKKKLSKRAGISGAAGKSKKFALLLEKHIK